MAKTAFAIAAHPDDIELSMAGTLLMLKKAGYEIHYMNISNGDLGSMIHDRETTAKIRRLEAMASAAMAGAVFHESIGRDIEILYTKELYSALVPEIREADPEIILTHSPCDYMEDHINAGRLAVSAAFFRGIPNCPVTRPAKPVETQVAIYHAMPHGLRDQLNRPVVPELLVNTAETVDFQKKMLCCHKSQKEWLDVTQGPDVYLKTIDERGEMCAKFSSGRYRIAEGWIQHNPMGYCLPGFNPLADALKDNCMYNPEY